MSTTSGGGTINKISSKLDENYFRSVGSFNNSTGVQTRISRETSLDRYKENYGFSRQSDSVYARNRYTFGKRRYRKGGISTISGRFLQYIVSGPQKEWESQNGDKFKTSERLFKKDSFQNGHNEQSVGVSETKRLGHFSGSSRCIFTCPNFSSTQTVHEISCPKSKLSVESNVLRTNMCSTSFHKNSFSRGSVLENTKYQTNNISRRLVDCKSKQDQINTGSTEMYQSFGFTGFHYKQREIQSCSESECNIPGRGILVRQGDSTTNFRESTKSSTVDSENVSRSDSSIRFSENFRHDGFIDRSYTKCKITYEASTITSIKFLESGKQRYDNTDSFYTTSEIPSFVVDKFSQHAERPIFSVTQNKCYGHNRCFEKRFWGLYWEPNFSGRVEFGSETLAHKLSRNEGCYSNNKTFSESTAGQGSFDQKRQHKCGPVYQSSRGHEIAKSLFSDVGIVATSHRKQYDFESGSHYRQQKHFSRPVEPNQNPSNGMDIEQGGCKTDFSNLGETFDRSVCFGRQQTDRDILHLDSGFQCISSRCDDNITGEHVCICFSPALSDSEDTKIYEAIPLPDHSDCPPMAEEILVSRNIGATDSLTFETSCLGQFTESTKNSNLSSQSPGPKSKCMASIDRSFETEGFSGRARNLLSASWRKGTQKDYSAKFDKFSSWCDSKQVDPYKATLNEVADFLAYLFESGLQYRTIAGYRSMLSAVLPPIQNCPVGQHPHISRLIKGVFHSRPPKIKLLPEWDLEVVLSTLEKHPFEPLPTATLKCITLKTVFLLAITTFRRCSDLQSLRIDQESMKVQEKGITFIRHGLSKQDRQNHYGIKIHVPSFDERTLVDPKRSLNLYLEKTKNIREKLNATDRVKLFLALNEPHKPVTTATISSWIVQTIKMAYDDDNLKVKAHSTRAIAPSFCTKGLQLKLF